MFTDQSIIERLEKVDSQNRKLKVIITGSLFLGCVLGVLSTGVFGYARSQTPLSLGVPTFVNGQRFLGWSEDQRDKYTMGLIDGFGNGAFLTDDGWRLYQQALPNKCFDGMSSAQVTAIIEKYLRENPELWDRSMTFLGWNAIVRACKSR